MHVFLQQLQSILVVYIATVMSGPELQFLKGVHNLVQSVVEQDQCIQTFGHNDCHCVSTTINSYQTVSYT